MDIEDLHAFLFFAMLVGFKKQLSKLSLLKAIGKISLPIYLVQTPICAIVYILAQYFLKVEGIWIALSSQILIFCFSFCVACLLTKTPYIRNLLFPREWNSILKR